MRRRTGLWVAAALATVLPACSGSGATTESAPASTTALNITLATTTLVPTTMAPAPTTTPSTTLPASDPEPRDELGTCEVMGASDGGWEVVLRIEAVLGGGTYRVEYALRDGEAVILDRVHAEIALSEDDVVQYWDSPRTTVTGVVSCDVLRLLQGNESCVDVDDCVLSV